MTKLSIAIITLNEEVKLPECLRSVQFADEIVVVDAHSKDRTIEVASQFGARCYTRRFDYFSAQKNFAIEQTSGDWILLLDADERVTPGLQAEIQGIISNQDSPHQGYWLKRNNYIFGGPMRFGATSNDSQLRLIRKGAGEFSGWVHERIQLKGTAGFLNSPLEHYSFQTLEDYFKRFVVYTSLDAHQAVERGIKPGFFHILIKPVLEFFYFYILRLGFLDGWRGLQYQLLASFYTHIKYAKAREFSKSRANHPLSAIVSVESN